MKKCKRGCVDLKNTGMCQTCTEEYMGMMDVPKQNKSSWEERFDEEFTADLDAQVLDAGVPPESIKQFITNLLLEKEKQWKKENKK